MKIKVVVMDGGRSYPFHTNLTQTRDHFILNPFKTFYSVCLFSKIQFTDEVNLKIVQNKTIIPFCRSFYSGENDLETGYLND